MLALPVPVPFALVEVALVVLAVGGVAVFAIDRARIAAVRRISLARAARFGLDR